MSTPGELQALLATFPTCGLTCLIDAIQTQSNCSLTDPACACSNQAVQATAETCIVGSCSIPDALTTQNLTFSLCGVTSYHDHAYITIIYTFIALAALLVALRFLTRLTKRIPLWWDDYSVLVAVAIAIAFTAVCGVYDKMGVGLDFWAVPQENIEPMFVLLFVALICYALSRCFARISISLFLLRIFRVSGARPLIILTVVLNVAVTITFLFCVIFQCTPVSYFWRGWDGLHEGSCIDQWPMFLAGGCIAAALDIFIILLPMRWISQLQFSRAKKITTAAMFSLGVIVIATSIMRVVSLYTFTHSTNVTRNLTNLVIWGGLELDVAIICACLPSLRPLFRLVFSRFQIWATGNSQGSGKNSKFSSNLDPRLYSGSKKKLVSQDSKHIEIGKQVTRPPNIWLTTTVQQQHQQRRLSESEMNLTTTATHDIELYDRKHGHSRGDAWA